MIQNTTNASMNFNKITLAFSEVDERLFLKKYFSDSIFQFRIAFILVIILYGAFGYLDSLIIPKYATAFQIIRFLFVIPLLLIVFFLSFTRLFQKVWQVLLLISVVAGGLGISIMTMLAPENYTYYAGLMLVFSAGYFFIKLRFFLATIAGWSILLMYNMGAIFYAHTPNELLISNNFFFISANIIGMFAAYYIEYYTRRNFFLSQKLDNEKLLVLDANKNLERTVEERTKELLKAKEKAEESDRLKTAFLQNMSHEIRTPMNAIIGFTGFLDDPELSTEQRNSFVSIIQNSTNQLLSIITDILSISSIETNQEKANIDKVCINNIVVDLLAIFKTQAQNQNISLYAKQQLTDKQSEIYTDKTKVTQILTNLLTNALKFTQDGFIEFGYTLVVGTRHALSLQTEMEFYVKDTGIGIKPEMHEKIFERFRQADKTINKLYGGTGLGLAISKAFAELLGGKIWVQSELEKGSTFYFTIPYKPVYEIDKTTSQTQQTENKVTILIAEDEEYNFLYLEGLLNNADINIIHTKDGKETVDYCRQNTDIDLILMDIKMPIMTGHEAAIIIKELNPNLPIVAQSAYNLEHEREKYSGTAFDDYITKPINRDKLKQITTKYIDKHINKWL